MATVNFNTQRKTFLKIILNDEEKTAISVLQPTKYLFNKMIYMSDQLSQIAMTDFDALDEIYEVCAELLSRNRESLKITKEKLSETMDFEDLIIFMRAYGTFVAEIIAEKN